jgi:thiosulfate reductase cytochrome b subunit
VADSTQIDTARHPATVRVTHWLTTISFLALLITGVEIVISHPRFYWGEDGNVLMPPLFSLPIPASRASVPTGYGFVLPDQNGWSRSLHFEAAWAAVFTALLYVVWGLASGHFRRNLLPAGGGLSREAGAWSYNAVQRLVYLVVIFILAPLMLWTGLAMSPAIASVFPWAVAAFGGQQSARTLHFFGTALLFFFLIVHIVMVYRAGFGARAGAMITGRAEGRKENA